MLGILDLQGGVAEHLAHFGQLGLAVRRVKVTHDLDGLTGLVLPGGESTCLSRLLRITGMDKAITAAHQRGMKLWGTCAGAILVASEIAGESPHLALLDITIQRNAFGSQLDSFNGEACIPEIAETPLPLTFIRAPVILRAGPGVRVLLRVRDSIAAAESDSILVTTFHPELTPGLAVHAYFARKCGLAPQGASPAGAWHQVEWLRFTQPQPQPVNGQ